MFLLFFACDNTSSKQFRSSYKITGEFSSDSFDGKTIYLENYLWYMQMSANKTFDSAVIHGKNFEITGKTDSSYIAVLSVNNRPHAILFVENGNIKIDITDIENNIATGTKLNDLFASYNQNVKPIKTKINELIQYAHSQERTDELDREVNAKYDSLTKEIRQVSIDFLDTNPGTLLSAFILLSAMSQGLDDEFIQSSYDKFDDKVKNSAMGNIIKQEVERAKIKEIAVDESFRDLTLQTPEDKEISISDYAGKGKYVLLDFWASWCGPCRAENPNIVALYNDYKDKGLEIVGVSLDDNKEAWLKGIKDDGIIWPQMSDLKGWQSKATATYRIQGIPYTVLLDKEGKVIATDLRGEALRDKIKTLIQ
jgi:thiol-disulfide isomerase/thioredoxin